jgi:hypothetical protein
VLSKPRPNETKASDFISCLSTEDALSTDTDPTIVGGKKCRLWQVNGDTPRNALPSYCTVTPSSSGNAAAAGEELHCAIDSIDYKFTDMVVLSGVRQVRFYFTSPSASSSDPVITGGSGNNAIYHCNAVSAAALRESPPRVACSGDLPSIRDLALFGCNSCGQQYVDLKGTPDALRMFAYFPNGNFTLAGNPKFEGVLWANKIESSGNVTWTVPSSGLLDVLDYMGFVPRAGYSPGSINWILFDYVARATHSFAWRSSS